MRFQIIISEFSFNDFSYFHNALEDSDRSGLCSPEDGERVIVIADASCRP